MITRDAAHRYTYEGITYPGVTTILGVLDKSGPLMGWAARETATAAVKMVRPIEGPHAGYAWDYHALDTMLTSVGPEGVIKALASRSNWQRDEAAQLGTEVHALADRVVRGVPLPETMTDTQRKRVEHYARWWEASGWTIRLSEAMVLRKQDDRFPYGWGGTFDLLARDKDGRTILADVKTGKAVYREAVLQLAAYGLAQYVQPTLDEPMVEPNVYTMPQPDRYVILHVTADGVREVEISVGTPERMAYLACLELYHWTESMKGKKL